MPHSATFHADSERESMQKVCVCVRACMCVSVDVIPGKMLCPRGPPARRAERPLRARLAARLRTSSTWKTCCVSTASSPWAAPAACVGGAGLDRRSQRAAFAVFARSWKERCVCVCGMCVCVCGMCVRARACVCVCARVSVCARVRAFARACVQMVEVRGCGHGTNGGKAGGQGALRSRNYWLSCAGQSPNGEASTTPKGLQPPNSCSQIGRR
eukprot:15476322-Alexandrium_andersonii.AAC.1